MTWGSKENCNENNSANLLFLKDYSNQVSIYYEIQVSFIYFPAFLYKILK